MKCSSYMENITSFSSSSQFKGYLLRDAFPKTICPAPFLAILVTVFLSQLMLSIHLHGNVLSLIPLLLAECELLGNMDRMTVRLAHSVAHSVPRTCPWSLVLSDSRLFGWWGIWGSKNLINLPKVNHLLSSRAELIQGIKITWSRNFL